MTITKTVNKKLKELDEEIKEYRKMYNKIQRQKRAIEAYTDHDTGLTVYASDTEEYRQLHQQEEWVKVRMFPLEEKRDMLLEMKK